MKDCLSHTGRRGETEQKAKVKDEKTRDNSGMKSRLTAGRQSPESYKGGGEAQLGDAIDMSYGGFADQGNDVFQLGEDVRLFTSTITRRVPRAFSATVQISAKIVTINSLTVSRDNADWVKTDVQQNGVSCSV